EFWAVRITRVDAPPVGLESKKANKCTTRAALRKHCRGRVRPSSLVPALECVRRPHGLRTPDADRRNGPGHQGMGANHRSSPAANDNCAKRFGVMRIVAVAEYR